jgi:phosphoribosyl-dephospho-CoA transferase
VSWRWAEERPGTAPARHDLVRLDPHAWARLLEARPEVAVSSLLSGWCENGWPLVVRRPGRGREEAGLDEGLALGLPLPPTEGKQRLAFTAPRAAVRDRRPPLALCDVRPFLPGIWLPAADALMALSVRLGVELRVFGAAAWQALTGLQYLRPGSDLDLLVGGPVEDLAALLAGVAAVEARAPMRLDVEVVRADGVAANGRELHAGAPQVLVKTASAVELWPSSRFLEAV